MKYIFLALVSVLLFGCKEEKKWGVASFVDGVELSQACRANDPEKRAACFYYILGVVDSTSDAYAVKNGKDWLCGDPKRADVANAVLGYLSAHPDKTSLAASSVVRSAVDGAFGCSKEKG